MPLIDRVGDFKGFPTDWSVIRSKENKIPMFVCKLLAEEWLNVGAGQWEDWRGLGMEITAYLNLGNKAGEVNEVQVKALSEALGWDGATLDGLALGKWGTTPVRFTVIEEVYEGKTRRKVSWINHIDWEGFQIAHAEPEELKAMAAQWNSKLRAVAPKPKPKALVAGAVAAAAPVRAAPAQDLTPPPSVADMPPVRPAGPPVRRAPAAKVISAATKEAAWEAFVTKFKGDAEKAGGYWLETMENLFPGVTTDQISPEGWGKMFDAAATLDLPF